MRYTTNERGINQFSYFLFEHGKNSVLAAFEAESAALQYVRFVLESMKHLWHQSACKISLHAGPVYLEPIGDSDEKQLSGKSLQVVRDLNAVATKGSILASNYFAALLALDLVNFEIDYAGILVPEEGAEKTTVYKVKFRHFQ